MRKGMIILVIFLLTAIFIFNFPPKKITGEAVSDFYTYTKAICNESNFCQDYVIKCEGNKTIETSLISGAAVQQFPNWTDLRENRDFCD